MLVAVWLLMLTIAACRGKCINSASQTIYCKHTNFQNLLYDLDNVYFEDAYEMVIEDSEFVTIQSFFLPSLNVRDFSLRNSSTKFIQEGAFQDFSMRSMDLSRNNLEDISFVATLPKILEKLVLTRNKIKVIKNVFRNLTSLSHLDFSHCGVVTVDSDAFSSLTKNSLFLSLHNNNLTTFDVLFQNEVILDLDLSCNSLKTIQNNFKNKCFRTFNVSRNRIEKIDDMTFSKCGYDWIFDLSFNNRIFDLSFNNLRDTNFEISIKDLDLDILSLSYTNMDSNFDFKIAKNVHDQLDLSNNQFGPISAKMFASGVSLQYLNLSNSSITDIAEFGFEGLSVQTLNLSLNLMSQVRNHTFKNAAIGILDMSRCLIETIEEEAFAGLNLENTLDLSHNLLEHLPKKIFGHLNSVRIIDLSHNFFTTIQDNVFQNCSYLTVLNLANSEIKSVEKDAFIGTNLMELHLENNFLGGINFTLNRYSALDVINNSFFQLSLSFLSTFSPQSVNFSGNDIRKLLNVSQGHSLVEKIDLSHSNISEIESGAFRALSSVEFLNLSNNCLEEILPNTFLTLRKLRQLDLANNNLIRFSPSAFSFWNKLEELRISFHNFVVASNTFLPLHSLRRLNICNSNNVSLETDGFKGLLFLKRLALDNVQILNVASGSFQGLIRLEHINFTVVFNHVDTIKRATFDGLLEAKLLDLTNLHLPSLQPEAFQGLPALRVLLLNHSQIQQVVDNTFLGLSSLEYLDLSHNQITLLESRAFEGLINLQHLVLSNNNLTRLRLGTFQNFPSLRTLDLFNNNINKLLTGTFSNLKSLEVLNMSYNNVTKLKMQVLMPLTRLVRLDLTGNHLIQIIHLELIKSLRYLQYVGIKENKWKCDNLALMLMAFQNYSIDWVSKQDSVWEHENIDGIKCYDICKFFYCTDEAEVLWGE